MSRMKLNFEEFPSFPKIIIPLVCLCSSFPGERSYKPMVLIVGNAIPL